jgi:hypothetical protein
MYHERCNIDDAKNQIKPNVTPLGTDDYEVMVDQTSKTELPQIHITSGDIFIGRTLSNAVQVEACMFEVYSSVFVEA